MIIYSINWVSEVFMRIYGTNHTILIGLLLALILSACAAPKYQQDFKAGTQFSDLKTYSWRNLDVQIEGASKPQLQRLLDEQLQSQGYQLVQDKPDMLLDMQGFTRVSEGGNTSLGIGIGLPVGSHGSIGLGTDKMIGQGKQEAVIVLDISRADSNTLVWRGNAEKIPLSHFKLDSEQKLRDSISKLLTQFPPK
jgi:hypothetical protein